MKAKTKIGMSMKAKKKPTKKKRIFPTAKQSSALSILPMLGALGSLIGGTSVTKAINDRKTARRQLEELRHPRAMKTRGQGLYLAPYKDRRSVTVKKERKKKTPKKQ
ncbi:hypothetical protein P5V15_005869 [Pogonomyrmex californicus]